MQSRGRIANRPANSTADIDFRQPSKLDPSFVFQVTAKPTEMLPASKQRIRSQRRAASTTSRWKSSVKAATATWASACRPRASTWTDYQVIQVRGDVAIDVSLMRWSPSRLGQTVVRLSRRRRPLVLFVRHRTTIRTHLHHGRRDRMRCQSHW